MMQKLDLSFINMTKFCPKCVKEYSFLSHSVFKNTGMWICSKCDNEKLEEQLKNWENEKSN